MDSRPETYDHILKFQGYLHEVIQVLQERQLFHDTSKLVSPEVEYYDKVTEKLAGLTYGSPEYKDGLKELGPAIEHHYANNRHHPESHKNGIRDMTLIDIMEMLCDWTAASHRHNDGNIRKSIEINQERFGYSDELKQILKNTVQALGF